MKTSIHHVVTSRKFMSSVKYFGWGMTIIGGAGVLLTAIMGYTYAPLVQSPPFRSPEAYRILFGTFHLLGPLLLHFVYCLLVRFLGS